MVDAEDQSEGAMQSLWDAYNHLDPKRQRHELMQSLWRAYQHDQDPQWLVSMVSAKCFEYAPMPNEISTAFAMQFGKSGRKNDHRDENICRLYGSLHPDFDKQFNMSCMRDVLNNFTDLNYEIIRNVLRLKFDPEKHIVNKGGKDF